MTLNLTGLGRHRPTAYLRFKAWWRTRWLPNAVIFGDGIARRIGPYGHVIMAIQNFLERRLRAHAERTERRLKACGH